MIEAGLHLLDGLVVVDWITWIVRALAVVALAGAAAVPVVLWRRRKKPLADVRGSGGRAL